MPKPKFNFNNVKTEPVKPEKTSPSEPVTKGKDIPDMISRLEKVDNKALFNFKFIPRTKIVMNKKNEYSQVNLEKLAASLLRSGLIHNLEGLYDEETDTYILESGERRTRALDSLFEKFQTPPDPESEDYSDYILFLKNIKGLEQGYPMKVQRKEEIESRDEIQNQLDEIDSELRLQDANIEIRPDTPDERLKNIEKRNNLLKRKNEMLPRNNRINVNEAIAEQEGISKRQVQKYNNILSLIPELQEEFKKNNFTLNEGSTYASLSEVDQRHLAVLLGEGKKVSSTEIKRLQEQIEESSASLKDKEVQMNILESEKNELLKKSEEERISFENALKAQEEILRKNIEAEINANHPDKKKVAELQNQLLKIETSSRQLLSVEHNKVSQKEQEIAKLQEEINILKSQDQKPMTEKLDIEMIRMETKVTSSLEQIEKSLDSLIMLLNENQGEPVKGYRIQLKNTLKKHMNTLVNGGDK